MAAGLLDSDAYTERLRWGESLPRDGSAEQVAATIARELDHDYPTIDWRATADSLKASE